AGGRVDAPRVPVGDPHGPPVGLVLDEARWCDDVRVTAVRAAWYTLAGQVWAEPGRVLGAGHVRWRVQVAAVFDVARPAEKRHPAAHPLSAESAVAVCRAA